MIHLSFLLWAAILMSTLILAHEFAHLFAAIAVGVKVEVFSLGFGRRLCGFSAYGIDFRLSAIPLGGYVRMHGENTTTNETGAASVSFSSKPHAARALILLAGPLVNCLLAPILFSGLYWHGFIPLIPTNQPSPIRLRTILPNSPAADAGLMTGDVLQAANEQSLRDPEDAITLIRNSPGHSLHFVISRGGQIRRVTVIPQKIRNGTTIVGRLGATFEPQIVKLPFSAACRYGTWTTLKLAQDMAATIVGLATGKISASRLIGPIGIAQISGQAAAQGTLMFIAIVALLSLNLGLFNLLPIPVLDGGALAVLLTEAIAGRDLKPKVKENITKLGFAMIVGMMAMVTFNDIIRIVGQFIGKP